MNKVVYNIRAKTKDNKYVFLTIKGKNYIYWTYPSLDHHWWFSSYEQTKHCIIDTIYTYLHNSHLTENINTKSKY